VELMRGLQDFVRRIEAAQTPPARALDDARDAARAGLTAEAWRDARKGPLDLALLRALHRAASAGHEVARRARVDGAWILGPANPGQLRTKPQAFRLHDHVEPAWAPGALKGGLARLLDGTGAALAADPVACVAELVWGLSRAQPFAAGNERVALIAASRLLRAAGLPGLSVDDTERDPAFVEAMLAATAGDRGALERALAAAIWDAALVWAEWLGGPPPADPARWTLRDGHAALEAARRGAARVSDGELDAFIAAASDRLAAAMAARLGQALAPPERSSPGEYTGRLAVALASARRGRRICPHAPVTVVRFPVEGALGLEVSLTAGAAGRGITGAAAVHLALAPRDAIGAGTAPGFLVITDEPAPARAARFAAWLDGAIARLLADGPVRI
jgi:fido (protein-threonine AMPylation protein)